MTHARSLLFLALALAVFALFAVLGTPEGHSHGFNLSWFVQFEALLGAGVPWPRHFPDMWSGLAGLDFFFYAPLPFYAAAGPGRLLCPGCAPATAFALGGAWLLILASLAFHALARRFVDRPAAALAAIVYALLPYHLLIDWGLRQAVGEFAAYMFVPLMALGYLGLLERRAQGWLFGPGLAGLAFSHLPSALLAAHVFAALFLAWAWTRRRDPAAVGRMALRLSAHGLLGAALAAAYWLPALRLIEDVSPAALYGDYFDPRRWLFGPGLPENLGFALVLLACLVSAGVAAALAIAIVRPRAPQLAALILVPLALAAFLMSGLARPLWEHWIIARVQFPWRMLLFADLSAGLAVAVLADAAFRGRRRAGPALAAAIAAIALAGVLAGVRSWEAVAGGHALRGAAPALIGAAEYLPPPMFAALQTRQQAAGRPVWDSADIMRDIAAEAEAARSGATITTRDHRRYAIAVAPGAMEGHLPITFWQHMRAATADGTPVALSPDPRLGTVRFALAAPAGEFTLRLPLHRSERLGLAVSALALLVYLAGPAVLALHRRRRTGTARSNPGPSA